MSKLNWSNELPFSITVCDRDGIILEMNEYSAQAFSKEGGRGLIGTSLLDCHPEPSRTQLAEMLQTRSRNVYTIEKNGEQKLVYQSPWYEQGEYKGFVELSIELPGEIRHRARD